jgi:hypothetical protein
MSTVTYVMVYRLHVEKRERVRIGEAVTGGARQTIAPNGK